MVAKIELHFNESFNKFFHAKICWPKKIIYSLQWTFIIINDFIEYYILKNHYSYPEVLNQKTNESWCFHPNNSISLSNSSIICVKTTKFDYSNAFLNTNEIHDLKKLLLLKKKV